MFLRVEHLRHGWRVSTVWSPMGRYAVPKLRSVVQARRLVHRRLGEDLQVTPDLVGSDRRVVCCREVFTDVQIHGVFRGHADCSIGAHESRFLVLGVGGRRLRTRIALLGSAGQRASSAATD